MSTARTLTRFGATLALALTLAAATAPSFVAFADDGDDGDNPGVAPFVIKTVDDGIQTAAGATVDGLNTAGNTSGEGGLNIGAGGVQIGAGAAGAGLGIPRGILGR